jgi:hypothetical protein
MVTKTFRQHKNKTSKKKNSKYSRRKNVELLRLPMGTTEFSRSPAPRSKGGYRITKGNFKTTKDENRDIIIDEITGLGTIDWHTKGLIFIEEDEILHFWRPFFNNNDRNIHAFKHKIMLMLSLFAAQHNPLCEEVKTQINRFDLSDEVNQAGLSPYYCFMTILIGLISNILKTQYRIILKGGRAIQLALSKENKTNPIAHQYISSENTRDYKSDDIDIIITRVKNSIYSVKDVAVYISSFIVWVTSYYSIDYNDTIFDIKDMQKTGVGSSNSSTDSPVDAPEGSIIKISITSNKTGSGRHKAIADIGYGYISPQDSKLFHSQYDTNEFEINLYDIIPFTYNKLPFKYKLNNILNRRENANVKSELLLKGIYFSVTFDELMSEKIHYIIKYIHLQNNAEPALLKFRGSLHKSINALLQDIVYNSTATATTKDELIDFYINKYIKDFELLRLPTGTPSTPYGNYGVKSLTSDFVYGSLQTTELSSSPPTSSTALSKMNVTEPFTFPHSENVTIEQVKQFILGNAPIIINR